MMMSMYSALSGLKSQQTKLNVISNNIANVNTAGYKSQTVGFADLLSQTIAGATGANAATGKGGTNAQQIGLGVSVSSISTNMTTGSSQYTGNDTDLMISGSGFFILEGGSTGEHQFSRAGNFGVDASGNLTLDGYKVCGWQDNSSGSYNTQTEVEPINLFSDSYTGNKKVIAPSATSEAVLTGNLDPSATAHGTYPTTIDTTGLTADGTSTMTVYDTQGNSYDVKVNFYKVGVDGTGTDSATTTWKWELADSSGALTITGGEGYLAFDANGKIITSDTTYATNPSVTLAAAGASAGSAPFTVALDFSDVSTYSGDDDSGVTATANGYESGELQSYSMGSDGIITGTYSNGKQQTLGQIALAVFNNASGLEKIGNNLYVTTANSGDYTGGVVAGTHGSGALSSGTLEMSNVDLASQLSEMMITQRAYQANSKIITTSDTILQEIINMVR